MMKLLRILLLPISLLYGGIMAVRNVLFSLGVLKSETYDLPVLSIGNITVGGTGKTPHTEYLIDLLGGNRSLAILSRGYGRKTKGFRKVELDSTPESCGDEPCQIKQKYPSQLVVVDEDRRDGIAKILEQGMSEAIILDDAYQHRWVKPGLSIVLVDYGRPLFNDFVMPSGMLREFSYGLQRADVIVVSKCPPEISNKEKDIFRRKLKVRESQDLFFSTFVYKELRAVFTDDKILDVDISDVLLLTGIANPQPLKDWLEQQGARVSSMAFPDHHQFKESDIDRLGKEFERLAGDNSCIVTTEKDAMRLRSGLVIPKVLREKLYYVPIAVEIIDRKDEFNKIITDYVEKN